MSEDALAAALAAAQGEFPSIPRNKEVKTGSYSFSYAPLDTILAACRPVLAKHQLALVQLLEHNGNGPAIRTELRHASGGVIGASFPLPGDPQSPQQLGSLLTYMRRYAISALLGIAGDEDDDGQQAAHVKPNPQLRQKVVIGPEYEPPPDVEPGPDFGPIDDPADQQLEPTEHPNPFKPPAIREGTDRPLATVPQTKKIWALMSKLSKTGDPRFELDSLRHQLGLEFGTEDPAELYRDQARDVIDRLVKREQELGL
jgi:ERF superfamily